MTLGADDLPFRIPPSPDHHAWTDPVMHAVGWLSYVYTCTNPTDDMERSVTAALNAVDDRALLDRLVEITGDMHRHRLGCQHRAVVIHVDGTPLDLSGQPPGLVATTRAVIARANREDPAPLLDTAWADPAQRFDVLHQAMAMFRDVVRDRYPWWSTEC